MNENTTKRRDWIKNAMIVFLTVMLILTFFSNTIMNYSLPEVAIQNATSASITAKVRGTGTVEASDPYNVEIKESRVIASVAVKQGDTVEKDDVLFTLEDADSAELLEAQTQLDTLRLEYEKAILSADSSSSLVDKVETSPPRSRSWRRSTIIIRRSSVWETRLRATTTGLRRSTRSLASSGTRRWIRRASRGR